MMRGMGAGRMRVLLARKRNLAAHSKLFTPRRTNNAFQHVTREKLAGPCGSLKGIATMTISFSPY